MSLVSPPAPLSHMPALLAPQPLLATISIPSPPPIYYTPDTFKRLKSPICLSDSLIRSPHPAWPPQRRRAKAGSHSLKRRRPLSRVDCRVESPPHVFDQLPWISALESAPDNLNPWDIADLSQVQNPISSDLPTSGLGPVRRRKTSLRSNPMAANDTSVDSPPWFGSMIPLCDTFSNLATPPSRFSPSRILFRDLMPVLYDDGSHPCINTDSFNF